MKFIEYELQCSCVMWTKYQYPNIIIHSIPNGAKVGARCGARLKKEGLLAGTPDLFIAEPKGRYHGIYAEAKSPGKKPNPTQRKIHEQLRNKGYFVFWFDNFNDYRLIFQDYLALQTGGKLNELEN